jgi:hypothetical protein
LKNPVRELKIISALEAGLSHHRQLAKERALLERTLSGSVKMLIEMLSVFHPEAFRRTPIIRQQAVRLAREIGLKKTLGIGNGRDAVAAW